MCIAIFLHLMIIKAGTRIWFLRIYSVWILSMYVYMCVYLHVCVHVCPTLGYK